MQQFARSAGQLCADAANHPAWCAAQLQFGLAIGGDIEAERLTGFAQDESRSKARLQHLLDGECQQQ